MIGIHIRLLSSRVLFALYLMTTCTVRRLPGWLSGHLAKPPTNRSCVDRMKLRFFSKFVYWNTSNSWKIRVKRKHLQETLTKQMH